MWDTCLIFLTFFKVCPLELWECVLCIVSVGRGRPLQIVLDALFLAILSVLWMLTVRHGLGVLKVTSAYLQGCQRVNNINNERIHECLSSSSFYMVVVNIGPESTSH